jgi:hypothetical protein
MTIQSEYVKPDWNFDNKIIFNDRPKSSSAFLSSKEPNSLAKLNPSSNFSDFFIDSNTNYNFKEIYNNKAKPDVIKYNKIPSKEKDVSHEAPSSTRPTSAPSYKTKYAHPSPPIIKNVDVDVMITPVVPPVINKQRPFTAGRTVRVET